MALDNIPTLGPGSLNSNLDKVLVYKNGGSEVAVSLLTLTNSALNLSGVYLDTVNGRMGIGVPNPTSTLEVSGTINGFTFAGASGDRRMYTNSNYFFLIDNSGTVFQMQGGKFSTSQFDGTAKFNIRGSGSTSATSSLIVQNSSGTTAFQVKDNLQASVGNGFGGDGIRFEPGNNSAIVFTQGSDRCYLQRQNSDKLLIYARGFQTYIGEGISTDGGGTFEWKMEGQVTAAVTMDTTKYVKVFINGVAYKLAVCV
jgi:hypothetical protein